MRVAEGPRARSTEKKRDGPRSRTGEPRAVRPPAARMNTVVQPSAVESPSTPQRDAEDPGESATVGEADEERHARHRRGGGSGPSRPSVSVTEGDGAALPPTLHIGGVQALEQNHCGSGSAGEEAWAPGWPPPPLPRGR